MRRILGATLLLLLTQASLAAAQSGGVPTPILKVQLTPHLIGFASGAGLALIFAYFPGLNTWYAGLKSWVKSVIMIGMMAATAFAIQGLGCLGIFSTGLPCTGDSWWMVLAYFGEALVTNQPTHQIAPETKGVKAAKARRAP